MQPRFSLARFFRLRAVILLPTPWSPEPCLARGSMTFFLSTPAANQLEHTECPYAKAAVRERTMRT
jgi:hypothetical protein